MSVRISHRHDDKVCYVVWSRQRLEDAGLCMSIDPVTFKTTWFTVAYMPYSGHWYAWDRDTGRELATFTRDFYEAHIKKLRYADLIIDPDCKV